MKGCRVPYAELRKGQFKPFFEIIFSYGKSISSKTLGLIDSGADQTMIPYSKGKEIGLTIPSNQEKLETVSGISGSLNYIKRNCKIFLVERKTNSIYEFNETVLWIYPNNDLLKRLEDLRKHYLELKYYKEQCIVGTPLGKYFQTEMNNTLDAIIYLNNSLEPDTLLGRNFFNNFDNIQFFQRDRDQEEACFFTYKLNESKIVKTLPIK